MAVRAVPIVEIPGLDQVPEPISVGLSPQPASFAVIGHRGNGMNSASQAAMRENSIRSFKEASRFQIPFIEFDVQVTRDGSPVVFHDVFIFTRDDSGGVSQRRVTDLSLEEFLSYGSQRDPSQPGKPLLRRAADGRIYDWVVESDDPLCTLEEAFRCGVDPRLGFNIELKFDNDFAYREEDLEIAAEAVLGSVTRNACGRRVILSTFHPDAARIVRRMQKDHPVYFLTDGGKTVYSDLRRNSLEEAAKLCVENGLEGVVSEARAVFREPATVARIKERNLRLLTFGALNNTVEVVYMQRVMGIDGVIVDRVQEISEASAGFSSGGGGMEFSEGQLRYLWKLIAELVRS